MTSGANLTGLVYDVENRLVSVPTYNQNGSGTEQYAYEPGNKRIYKRTLDGTEELYFYGISGQKLGTYRPSIYQYGVSIATVDTNLYFGARTIVSRGVTVTLDRLGSNRAGGSRYFPYGEEQQVTAQDRDKFATYYRDGTTGLDYADQRYYASTYGRFITTDPRNAGTLRNPQSFNLYSYTLGDPVNSYDPQGLCSIIGGGITQSAYSDSSSGEQEFADEIGGITVLPYANGSILGGVANVITQGLGIPTGATASWLNAIALAAQTPGPINIYAFSGSAGAFTAAFNWLTADEKARITNITYISPGNYNQPLATGNPGTKVTVYTDNSDAANVAVQLFGSQPDGPFETVNTGKCGHNSNCVYKNFEDKLSQTATSCNVGAGAVFGLPPRVYTHTAGYSWSNLLFWIAPPPVPSVTTTIHYDLP